jgi:hypothetical protein
VAQDLADLDPRVADYPIKIHTRSSSNDETEWACRRGAIFVTGWTMIDDRAKFCAERLLYYPPDHHFQIPRSAWSIPAAAIKRINGHHDRSAAVSYLNNAVWTSAGLGGRASCDLYRLVKGRRHNRRGRDKAAAPTTYLWASIDH